MITGLLVVELFVVDSEETLDKGSTLTAVTAGAVVVVVVVAAAALSLAVAVVTSATFDSIVLLAVDELAISGCEVVTVGDDAFVVALALDSICG